MSNSTEGYNHYINGGNEARSWFEHQWTIWPERADDRYTTNLTFHYGGVQAFRSQHGEDPEMSDQFKSCVHWQDKH